MAKLTQIYIYPIKSLPGIQLTSSNVENRGLEGDRRWMLIDKSSKFITLREYPELTQFSCGIEGASLRVNNQRSSIIIRDGEYSRMISAQIWTDTVNVLSASDEVNSWFTESLGISVSLVRVTDETMRNPNYNNGNVSFADRWPFLILGTKSIEDLNTRLQSEVDYLRFRPNLVVNTESEYEEDKWLEFTIGSAQFSGKGPCGRCKMVNIDSKSGEIGENVLKILSTYRGHNNKIVMGLQATALEIGKLSIGDQVEIEK